jgi:hypothetical protein
MSRYQEKIIRHTRKKKTKIQFEDTEQTSESDMERCWSHHTEVKTTMINS